MKTYVIRKLTEWDMLAIDEGLRLLEESGKPVQDLRRRIEERYQGQRHDKVSR